MNSNTSSSPAHIINHTLPSLAVRDKSLLDILQSLPLEVDQLIAHACIKRMITHLPTRVYNIPIITELDAISTRIRLKSYYKMCAIEKKKRNVILYQHILANSCHRNAVYTYSQPSGIARNFWDLEEEVWQFMDEYNSIVSKESRTCSKLNVLQDEFLHTILDYILYGHHVEKCHIFRPAANMRTITQYIQKLKFPSEYRQRFQKSLTEFLNIHFPSRQSCD